MTVKEIKETIKNFKDTDEIVFGMATADKDGWVFNKQVRVTRIFNKANVKVDMFGKITQKILDK